MTQCCETCLKMSVLIGKLCSCLILELRGIKSSGCPCIASKKSIRATCKLEKSGASGISKCDQPGDE